MSERPVRPAATPPTPSESDASPVKLLAALPPLTMTVTVAALFELSMARLGWRGLQDVAETDTLRTLARLARFPRNLAAVAGLGALVYGLIAFLRLPGFAPAGRRLAVAAFSGVFVPAIAMAAVFPRSMLHQKLVLFGMAAANVLVTLLGMTAVRYRGGRLVRACVVGVTASGFLSLALVGLMQVAVAGQIGGSPLAPLSAWLIRHREGTELVLRAGHHATEVLWLLTGMVASGGVIARGSAESLKGRALGVAACSAVVGLLLETLRHASGASFGSTLIFTFRFSLLIDTLPGLYLLPLSVSLGGAFYALSRRDSAVRQLGAGTLLWVSAGFGPHTPIQNLYLVLGALLIIRSAQAMDESGPWLRIRPWARFRRSKPPGEEPASSA